MSTDRDLAIRWSESRDQTHEGYMAARAWFLGELGPVPELEKAYALGKRLLLWVQPVAVAPHVCSGERVDNGRREYFECDDADSPRCPSYRPPAAAAAAATAPAAAPAAAAAALVAEEDERCSRCDVRKFEWYCEPCWNERRYT